MKAEKSLSPLAGAIGKMKEGKPFLHVTAHMDSGSYGPMESDMEWQKKDLKRLQGQVKAIEDQIEKWDAEEVAASALKSLKSDLAMKKARLMETEALLELNKKD